MPEYSAADDGSGSHGGHVEALGGNTSCDSCHPLPDAGNHHLNTTVEVLQTSFSYTQGTGTCSNITCHGNTDARWGTTGCLGCHSAVQGVRAAVGVQFTAQSHHVQGHAVTDAHCFSCHWEANSDGTIAAAYHGGTSEPGAAVDLVVYGAGTRPLAYTEGTTAVHYRADGSRDQIAKINDHCLGCHSDQNSTTEPFGDGKTPQAYAWDGTSIDSRYSQLGSTNLGKYPAVANAAQKIQTKAYSAHGKATLNQGGWSSGAAPAGTGVDGILPNTRNGTVNVACYDCHNSHGSNVSGKTTSYTTSATINGGLLKETQTGKGGYSMTYKPAAGGSIEEKNLRTAGASLCMDCHLTADGGTSKPWGYQATFGASQQILGYWDTPYFAPGDSGSQQRYAYKGQVHFNGGHFGASSSLAESPMASIDGLCTPCHDPHGVSPTLAGNQPYGVPLLKGTWLTSPYQEDVSPVETWAERAAPWNNDVHYRIDQNTFGSHINQLVTGITHTDTQFAGLCLTCHPKAGLTKDGSVTPNAWKSKERIHEAVKGWKTSPGWVKHTYSCSKCHSPHNGSGLPRLMVSNCLDWAHKGRNANSSGALATGSYSECGAGSGRIPGDYGWGSCIDWGYGTSGGNVANCHEGQNANAYAKTDQRWNDVTTWGTMPNLTITTPTAESGIYYPNTIRTIIRWNSNIGSDSIVYYGPTSSYGQVKTVADLVTNHSIVLDNLQNHTTYHYQVRSRTYRDQQVTSSDGTFTLNLPPSKPGVILEPDKGCPDGCSVPLEWNASTDPDGGTIEYYVELDSASTFDSVDKKISGWLATTSWTADALEPGKTWYWRVRARDANHTDAISAWSYVDAFQTLTYYPAPSVPNIRQISYDKECDCVNGCSQTLYWYKSTIADSDNGPVEYQVEVDSASTFDSPDKKTSAWVTGSSSLISTTVGPLETAKTWYWRVKARYTSPVIVESDWSTIETFATLFPNPTRPANLLAPAYTVCPTGNCSVPLSWNASTACGGEAVEYYVEADSVSTFNSLDKKVSNWVPDQTWTATPLDTAKTWFWHVGARVVNYPSATSGFTSPANSFKTMTAEPPPAPTLVPYSDFDSLCANTVVTVQWYPVTVPDGDPVHYYVNAGFANSGWLTQGETSWSFTVPPGTVTWNVTARDGVHQDATSTSANDVFSAYCNSGSCPFLFTWDGDNFAFESDLYGAGKLALKTSSGYLKPEPHDYYVLRATPASKNGLFDLRLVEERHEANYLDELKLYAVDVPADRVVFAEKPQAGGASPFTGLSAVLHTVASDAPAPTPIVHVNTGQDVTDILAADDDVLLTLNEDRNIDYSYQTLELDLGPADAAKPVKIVMDAMSMFPDSPEGAERARSFGPRTILEVQDKTGTWVKVPSEKGTLPKPPEFSRPYIFDISDIWASASRKVRFTFLFKTYIDWIRVDTTENVPVTLTEIPTYSAELRLHGLDPKSSDAELYEYVYGESNADSAYLPGSYTKYGDVRPLLWAVDDKFVIYGGGDEIVLQFEPPEPPASGVARSYLMYTNGYYKDLKVDVPHTVEPLPFADMSNFPYDPDVESYPSDPVHEQYRLEYNTRTYGE